MQRGKRSPRHERGISILRVAFSRSAVVLWGIYYSVQVQPILLDGPIPRSSGAIPGYSETSPGVLCRWRTEADK